MSAKAASIVLGNAIRELRFYFCQEAPGAAGIRQFVTNNYLNLKNSNPHVSILVRECEGIMPKFVARDDMGKEKTIEVPAMTSEQIMEVFRQQTK